MRNPLQSAVDSPTEKKERNGGIVILPLV